MDEVNLKSSAIFWVLVSISVPLLLVTVTSIYEVQIMVLNYFLVIGLLVFGMVFAINSSLHSFLILKFTTVDRAPLDVGFYYMANASGCLLGTLLSGLTYQIGGLSLCLFTTAIFLTAAAITTKVMPADLKRKTSLKSQTYKLKDHHHFNLTTKFYSYANQTTWKLISYYRWSFNFYTS